MPWPINGGWFLAFDPQLDPRVAPALWHADTTPAVLTLTTASPRPSVAPLSLDHLNPLAIGSRRPDEQHLVADDDHGRHRLLVRGRHLDGGPLALALPIDAAISIRLNAAARLTHNASPVSGYQPTPLQRTRLVLLLDILDAEAAGFSKRDIAIHLVYPRMPVLRGATWKASPERRRIHRLCLEAARLRDHGIPDLLHARLHRPG